MIERISKYILIFMIAWFMLSWMNIICHNSPVDGDYKYGNWNMFVITENLIDGQK